MDLVTSKLYVITMNLRTRSLYTILTFGLASTGWLGRLDTSGVEM